MDLDPDTGQYRISASVPGVEMNDLRKTLGVRPTPFPLGGALRGVLHCTGPLEQPVFSGESLSSVTTLLEPKSRGICHIQAVQDCSAQPDKMSIAHW